MTPEPQVPDFGTAISGYAKKQVDDYIAELQKQLSERESYNQLAIQEQVSLRNEVESLRDQVRNNKAPGYAQLGAQFEETLRLGEQEAARLVNEAGVEAIKIREEARAEAERVILEANQAVTKRIQDAERESREILVMAEKALAQSKVETEGMRRKIDERERGAERQAVLIRTEAESYAAELKAKVHGETEIERARHSDLLRENLAIEAEIRQKIDNAEKNALDIFNQASEEANKIRDEAQRTLEEATDQASVMMSQADIILRSAREDSDTLTREAEEIARNLMAESRRRAEALAGRVAQISRATINDAEMRLARLPADLIELEAFLKEVKQLISPDKALMLDREQALKRTLSQAPIEGEIMP